MGDILLPVLEGTTAALLEEFASLRAESQRLREELEAWGDVEDDRPTIPVPCRDQGASPPDTPRESSLPTLRSGICGWGSPPHTLAPGPSALR